jgi:guanylate kinase
LSSRLEFLDVCWRCSHELSILPDIWLVSSLADYDYTVQRLQEIRSEIHFVVTATTRPKRPGEVDGVDYYFVSKPEFLDLIARNELIEHALVYGDYKGVPKKQVRLCAIDKKSFAAEIYG